jgi:4-diphosphocytidyl-2-C-methyl-D-erythritol kinase
LNQMVLKSPAKINLFLNILRKREDGYHEIATLMQAIDLEDEIVLEKRGKGITLRTDHPNCPAGESNLAFKAAALLLEDQKISDGVSIQISKRIPIAAGLGGGSSNAAATLKGLNRLFELKTPKRRLHQLAAQLGSDVPFFLSSGQTLAKGRGEKLKPLTLFRDYWLVLVYPGFEVSTRWAYQNFKISLTRGKKEFNLTNLENRKGFFKALLGFDNDLEKAVQERYPAIGRIKDILISSGAIKSSMSGSGPTVYGVFKHKLKAEEVARKIRRGNWEVFLTQPIPV